MLDSNQRRPEFDAFFASLESDGRSVFLDEAMISYCNFAEGGEPISFIDAMENTMDYWRELMTLPDELIGQHERTVASWMRDGDRQRIEKAKRELEG